MDLKGSIAIFIGLLTAQLLIYHKFLSLTIVLIGVLTLFNLFKNKVKIQILFSSFLFVGLYIFYVIGTIWSENKPVAYFDLEMKMSFFAIPFIFSCNNLRKKDLKIILKIFILTLFFSSVYMLSRGALDTFETNDISALFYSKLSGSIHPSYLGFFVSVGLACLLVDYTKGNIELFSNLHFYIILIIYFTIFCLLLTSKSAIVTALIINISLFVFWIRNKKWTLFVTTTAMLVIASCFILNKSSFAKKRISEIQYAFTSEKATEYRDADNKIKYLSSTPLRKSIWLLSINLIKEKPLLGHGTGDVKKELMSKYEEIGNMYAYKKQLNAHNQFLQTSLAIGLLGCSLLILILAIPLIPRLKKPSILKWFCIITAFFFATESALERQAGVIGFLIFFYIFDHNHLRKQQDSILKPLSTPK